MQWSIYALEATRYHVALKYLALKAWNRGFRGPEQVLRACEEDQANYGIGARSARMALLLVMALLFCSDSGEEGGMGRGMISCPLLVVLLFPLEVI